MEYAPAFPFGIKLIAIQSILIWSAYTCKKDLAINFDIGISFKTISDFHWVAVEGKGHRSGKLNTGLL